MAKVIIYFDKASNKKPVVHKGVQHSAMSKDKTQLNIIEYGKSEKYAKVVSIPQDVIKVKVFTEKTIFRNEELEKNYKKNQKEQQDLAEAASA